MDDKEKVGGQDRSRINTSEDYEVQYWSEKFGCTEDELREAVDAAGSSPDRVEEYLNNR